MLEKPWLLLVLALTALIWVRATAPCDFYEGTQRRQVNYVVDILENGNFYWQYEADGTIATKPPLYNWLAAGVCKLSGSRAPWAMKLPSLLAAIVLLLITYDLGRRFFGAEVGVLAILVGASSHHIIKLAWYARTDMLMTTTVYAAFWLILVWPSGWRRGLGLALVVALSALAKGPIGPLLIAVFALCRGIRNKAWREPKIAIEWACVFGFVGLLTAFWLAQIWDLPQFRERVLGHELGRRVTLDAEESAPFYYPHWYFVARILPWSLVAMIGLWANRNHEQFKLARELMIYVFVLVTVFSFNPVIRHDHLLPTYPFAFLVCGWTLQNWMDSKRQDSMRRTIMATSILLVAATLLAYEGLLSSRPLFPSPWLNQIAASLLGASLALLFMTRKSRWQRNGGRAALVVLTLVVIFANGFYFHGFAPQKKRVYVELESFVAKVHNEIGEDEVYFHKANVLIPYLLRQHHGYVEEQELAALKSGWLIVDPLLLERLEPTFCARLERRHDLILRPNRSANKRRVDAALYRIQSP